MMKMLQRLSLLLPLLLMAISAQAQLFSAPQPLMFDRGYDIFYPPAGTKRIVLSRYIPGARFPKDYDVMVESLDYDKAGHLLSWKRFQNITGELTLQTDYTWAPEGHLLQERTTVASDRSELIRNYVWEKDGSGKFVKASINDKSGKQVSTIEIEANGNTVITEASGTTGKFIRSTYAPDHHLIKAENSATGQNEVYSYYPDGTVKELSVIGPKGIALVKYENKLDENGHVIEQSETGKTTPRTFYFSYDKQGHLLDKGTIMRQPTETRGYNVKGLLNDVLTFDAAGLSKEVLNISYEFWKK